MSYAVDANIIIYAYNEDSEFHKKAREFLTVKYALEETWIVPWQTLHAVLRITTHAGIMPQPLSPKVAISIVDEIISLPQVQLAAENEEFWDIYKEEFLSHSLRGNLVPDGALIAVLKSYGVTKLYTKDRDFLKFKDIKVIDPTV